MLDETVTDAEEKADNVSREGSTSQPTFERRVHTEKNKMLLVFICIPKSFLNSGGPSFNYDCISFFIFTFVHL